MISRRCLLGMVAASLFGAETRPGNVLRGKLLVRDGRPAAVETPDHHEVAIQGDNTTEKVLTDGRLNGYEVEAHGHFTAPDRFQVDPSHTRSLLVRQDGKPKLITYWCEICSIRAYTPGPCVCCQRETTLDLRDPDQQ